MAPSPFLLTLIVIAVMVWEEVQTENMHVVVQSFILYTSAVSYTSPDEPSQVNVD